MKKIAFISLILITLMTFNNQANAKGGGFFGKSDNIHKIESINMTGKNGEKLYIGYMTKNYYLIAGVYMKDEGYVIGIEGNEDSYYPMPEGVELKKLQVAEMIPAKLPEYTIPWLDYIIGYSLWILVAIFGGYSVLSGSKNEDED